MLLMVLPLLLLRQEKEKSFFLWFSKMGTSISKTPYIYIYVCLCALGKTWLNFAYCMYCAFVYPHSVK